MTDAFRSLGQSTLSFLAEVGAMSRLAVDTADHALLSPFRGGRVRLRATVAQAVRAGHGSLPLVAMICFLVGMIIALQSAYQLETFGALELVADLVAISISRELAPLLSAIVVAGRFGSAITAELGTMRVSQEIDALEVMGIDPVHFLVVPRFVALAVTLPCLTVFADLIGILGGMVVGVGVLGLGSGTFVARTIDALVLQDIYIGLVKATIYAAIIGLVGCHQGLSTRGGAEQVGRATTAAVVRSIVLIVFADLFVTTLFFVRG